MSPFKQLTVKIKSKNRRFDHASAVHKLRNIIIIILTFT